MPVEKGYTNAYNIVPTALPGAAQRGQPDRRPDPARPDRGEGAGPARGDNKIELAKDDSTSASDTSADSVSGPSLSAPPHAPHGYPE